MQLKLLLYQDKGSLSLQHVTKIVSVILWLGRESKQWMETQSVRFSGCIEFMVLIVFCKPPGVHMGGGER